MPRVSPPTPDCADAHDGNRISRAFSRLKCYRRDVQAVLDFDPAATDPIEVILTYPGLHALWLHRVSHLLWNKDKHLTARLLSHANRFLTGVEIHPAAELGQGVFIDHGMGVVIGETAKVGDNCILYKGVVLGGTTRSKLQRHPRIGKNVVVGSNACVLGNIEVGDGARIGSGSVVIQDVNEDETVVGVPGRAMPQRGQKNARFETALDHASLPDPLAEVFRSLRDHEQKLRARVQYLEKKLGIVHEETDDDSLLDADLATPDLPPQHGG